MRITFAGSSDGKPTKERACFCLMIEVNDAIYFIDAGAPIINKLLEYEKDVNKVKAIFTTHIHGDHTSGIFQYLDLINWYYTNNSVKVYLADPAFGKVIEQFIETAQYGTFQKDRIELIEEKAGTFYEDENIKLTAIPTKHIKMGEHPSFAFLIEAEGKKAVVTGDMSIALRGDDFPKEALEDDIDLIISEFAHFSYREIRPYLEKAKPKQFWFAHVAPLIKHQEIEEFKKDYSYPIFSAKDGDTIEL